MLKYHMMYFNKYQEANNNMAKSIKLTEDTYLDSESVSHNQKTLKSTLNSLIKYSTVSGLSLGSDDTYQLTLPSNTLFIEPLIQSSGADYGGGCFITPTGNFCYLTNNSLTSSESSYKGIWIKCSSSGLVTVSSYRHCGVVVTGFRIWYLNI